MIHLRVTAGALAALDQLAEAEDRTRSDMARLLMTEGLNARRTKR